MSSSDEHTPGALCCSFNELHLPAAPRSCAPWRPGRCGLCAHSALLLPPSSSALFPLVPQLNCTLNGTRSPMLPSEGVIRSLCPHLVVVLTPLLTYLCPPKNNETQDGIRCYSHSWMPTTCRYCYIGEQDISTPCLLEPAF